MKKSRQKQPKNVFPEVQQQKEVDLPSFLPSSPVKKHFLHVGCGTKGNRVTLDATFDPESWEEVRLDIDPAVEPDIVADMRSMSMVADGSMQAIWSSHNIEHVFAHEVAVVLAEFYRVLSVDGLVIINTPDIAAVAKAICEKGLDVPLYTSHSGPIAAIDILYGFRPSLAHGKEFMAHKTGLTAKLLAENLFSAGFRDIKIVREVELYNLKAVAMKRAEDTEENSRATIYLAENK